MTYETNSRFLRLRSRAPRAAIPAHTLDRAEEYTPALDDVEDFDVLARDCPADDNEVQL